MSFTSFFYNWWQNSTHHLFFNPVWKKNIETPLPLLSTSLPTKNLDPPPPFWQLDHCLIPKQLGVGVPGGCEAATHAARKFLNNMGMESIMVKLDISNAFNSLHRDSMLSSVDEILPELAAYCHLAYAEGPRRHLFSSENSLYCRKKVRNRETPWDLYSSAYRYNRSCPDCYRHWLLDTSTTSPLAEILRWWRRMLT